jgi:hypothetical protein
MPPEPTIISVMATLGPVNGSPRSTAAGTKGTVKFEVSSVDGRTIWDAMDGASFELIFGGVHLGDGFTVSNLMKRPDEDGQGRAFVRFVGTESTTPALGQLFTQKMIGQSAQLDLIQNQTRMDALLTTRATDPEPCPYPSCALQADHSGGHVLVDDLLPVN